MVRAVTAGGATVKMSIGNLHLRSGSKDSLGCVKAKGALSE